MERETMICKNEERRVWEAEIQKDFPFMQRNMTDEGNIYQKWGFECAGGWKAIIRECCEKIVARYAEDGISIDDIDFMPTQIKEKWGTLRFYYEYKDAPCAISAFDFMDLSGNGTSIRYEPGNEEDDPETKKRRHDISNIIKEAEKKSAYTCEICGTQDDKGEKVRLREGGRIQCLCEKCCEERKESIEDNKRRWEELKKNGGNRNELI